MEKGKSKREKPLDSIFKKLPSTCPPTVQESSLELFLKELANKYPPDSEKNIKIAFQEFTTKKQYQEMVTYPHWKNIYNKFNSLSQMAKYLLAVPKQRVRPSAITPLSRLGIGGRKRKNKPITSSEIEVFLIPAVCYLDILKYEHCDKKDDAFRALANKFRIREVIERFLYIEYQMIVDRFSSRIEKKDSTAISIIIDGLGHEAFQMPWFVHGMEFLVRAGKKFQVSPPKEVKCNLLEEVSKNKTYMKLSRDLPRKFESQKLAVCHSLLHSIARLNVMLSQHELMNDIAFMAIATRTLKELDPRVYCEFISEWNSPKRSALKVSNIIRL